MKRHIKFPSIDQFRTVVTNVNRHFNFEGLDENGDAIYDLTKAKPKVKFKGTVKLHGTNAAVSFNEGGYWAQSRSGIITPESDNAGFAFFVETKKEVFKRFVNEIQKVNLENCYDNTFTMYGEWCGGNIQKGVAITGLDKMFVIFGLKVTPHDETKPAYWIPYHYLKSNEDNIYNIDDFTTYEMEIDFNVPQLSQNKLNELTLAIGDECPVGKAFGVSGIGEGIVWSAEINGSVHRFKVKDERHSNSKVTTLKPVDDEKINKIISVVNQVTPAWRLDQMLTETFDLMNGGQLDIKQLGAYIKAVINDIIKEEKDTLSENGLEPKDIGKYVSETSRRFFLEKFNEM